jgi:hypothetical protein
MGVMQGDVPPAFGVTLPTNDLVWWVPFGMILYHAAKARGFGSSEAANANSGNQRASAS